MARRRGRTDRPALPSLFVERAARQLPPDELDALIRALDDAPPVSIRLNPSKPGGPEGAPVPWCGQGRYLADRPVFTLDPALHGGAYYVQEASSMLLEMAYRAAFPAGGPRLVLDLCAAPGGKSTHLRALLPAGTLLVCNEVDDRRRGVLAENLWKWGGANVMLTAGRSQDFSSLPGTFDLVVVDAPCSGEGLMRREPEARRQWTPGLVASCAATQRAILTDAWEALAPGGALIYSTCTWAPGENEEQVADMVERLGAEWVPLDLPEVWGFLTAGAGVRAWPHRVRGEGFFLALLRKPGRLPALSERPFRPGVLEEEGNAWLIDEDMRQVLDGLSRISTTKAPGTPLWSEEQGRTLPQAAAALCPMAFERVRERTGATVLEVDASTALAFLRGEVLRTGEATGWACVRHAGLGLGWVHGAGRRWNNHHPAAWRIRMR